MTGKEGLCQRLRRQNMNRSNVRNTALENCQSNISEDGLHINILDHRTINFEDTELMHCNDYMPSVADGVLSQNTCSDSIHQQLPKARITINTRYLHITCILLLLCTIINSSSAADASIYDSLYNYTLDGYNPHTLPILNYGDRVNISVRIFIISLNDYDQISGELSLTLLFMLNWLEGRIQWNASDYNNLTILQLPIRKLWIPLMFAREVSDSIDPLGPLQTMATVQHTGLVTWTFGEILKTTCSPDVTYFPFDPQTCVISFSIGNAGSSEIGMDPLNEYLETTYFSPNSQWKISPSPITLSPSVLTLSLKLERRTTFYVVYIIIPILLLGLINNLVLVLPSTSGERMSVAITTFLSFIVYMDIVNDNVPESSAPVPYLYYYLLFLMVYSALIMVLCIVSMRIHDKETQVPRTLEKIIQYARLRCFKTRKRAVSPVGSPKKVTVEGKEIPIDDHVTELNITEEEEDKSITGEPITWKRVSETFDIYCTLCLLMIYISITVDTFTKLQANKGL